MGQIARLFTSVKVKRLTRDLDNPDPEVRGRAAKEFLQLGPPHALDGLLRLVTDEHVNVRGASVVALGGLGDEWAVPVLVTRLRTDDNVFVKADVATALGKLGGEEAVEALVAAYVRGDEYVERSAAEALGKSRDLSAVHPLVQALEHDDWQVRKAAAYALGALGDWRVGDRAGDLDALLHTLAIPALAKALEDPYENMLYRADDESRGRKSRTGFVVRDAAAGALWRIGTGDAHRALEESRAPRTDWAPDKGWFGSGNLGRPDH